MYHILNQSPDAASKRAESFIEFSKHWHDIALYSSDFGFGASTANPIIPVTKHVANDNLLG